ncbi:hypothetical protein A9R00_13100 [Oleispira antarctica]|uniref:8-oxo-dGTP diphosphatase n=1 Tax=Oleispira antarctica TaxID=188908 RepID=A0A1Y5H7X5_OLEAN|nr:hypothetical protein A9R00_13100 [Oleispira antarctica]
MKKLIHVAVGVIFDCSPAETGKILIAKRADTQHQGGLWEFPGGKVEEGESVKIALKRELEEELGLQSKIEDMQPLITIPFHYSDKSVLLDVWKVYGAKLELNQQATGIEGQPLAWVEESALADYEFPTANKAIIGALSLPTKIAITEDNSDPDIILAQAAQALKNYSNIWIQLRAPSLNQMQYTQLAMKLYGICHEGGSKLIWNCPLDWYQIAFADGLHLSGLNYAEASSIKSSTHINIENNKRPIPLTQWLSMACHNLDELEVAQELADYILVSPVKETKTHPQANALTWSGFKVISEKSRIPCYALGGLEIVDICVSQAHGGQGIAGISCFNETAASKDITKNTKESTEEKNIENVEDSIEVSNEEKSYEG